MSSLLEIGVAGSADVRGTGCSRARLMSERSVLVVSWKSGSEKELVQLNQKERSYTPRKHKLHQ